MKTLATFALAAVAFGCIAPAASFAADRSAPTTIHAGWGAADQQIEKRRRPRIPGGSGCDDPRDVIEHPECRRR